MAHEKVTLNEKYNMEILERATEVIAKEQGKKNMPQVQSQHSRVFQKPD